MKRNIVSIDEGLFGGGGIANAVQRTFQVYTIMIPGRSHDIHRRRNT